MGSSSLLAQSESSPAGGRERSFTVDDLLNQQEMIAGPFSPDGRYAAVTITRPTSEPAFYRTALATYYDNIQLRGDVWLLPADGGSARNLTQGVRDSSGSFTPRWSPDGRWLAFLSTKGGDDVRLYVWDSKTDTTYRLADRGINLGATFVGGTRQRAPFTWLDDSTVLCLLMPPGEMSPYYAPDQLDEQVLERGWAHALRSDSVTASVLDAGGNDTGAVISGQLIAFNARSHTARTLAAVPFAHYWDSQTIAMTPGGDRAAIVTSVADVRHPPPSGLFTDSMQWSARRFGIVSVRQRGPIQWVPVDVHETELWDVRRVRTWWSPDGGTVAVRTGSYANPGNVDNITLVPAATPTRPRRLRLDVHIEDVHWISPKDILVRAVRRATRSAPTTQRADWWHVTCPTGAFGANVSGHLADPSSLLVEYANDGVAYAVDRGALWSVNLRSGQTQRVSVGDGALRRLDVVPSGTRPLGVSGAVATTVQDGQEHRYQLSLGDHGIVTSHALSDLAGATVFASNVRVGAVVLSHAARLFMAHSMGGTIDTLLSLREWPGHGVVGSKQTTIAYRGGDGDSLWAEVVLPPNYVPGRRYPVIVEVYAGDTHERQTDTALTFNVFAAQGFVVLSPSIPLPPNGVRSDPFIAIPKSTLPAIDRLIDMGIADPSRIGVYGHSFGGYTVYTLITQTNRFAAAVALAGPVDFTSEYGTFSGGSRYAEWPNIAGSVYLAEGGQLRMGGPPWTDLWHYWRNSPINYIDRVTTPLLIIHNDRDYVPVTQGEEVFTALWRLGRRVRFVRYIGEGHTIQSPANIRDQYRRVVDWFTSYLRVNDESAGGGDRSRGAESPTGR